MTENAGNKLANHAGTKVFWLAVIASALCALLWLSQCPTKKNSTDPILRSPPAFPELFNVRLPDDLDNPVLGKIFWRGHCIEIAVTHGLKFMSGNPSGKLALVARECDDE